MSEEERQRLESLHRENLHFRRDLPDLGNAASVTQLIGLVQRERIEVLFLDPLNGCLGAAGKDAANTPALTRTMLSLAAHADAGCTLVLIHHTAGDRFRQQIGQAREPLELQDLAWPGITNSVRQWILVARAEPYEHETRRSELWLTIGGTGMQAGGEFHATVTEGFNHDLWRVAIQSRTAAIEDQQSQRPAGEAQKRRQFSDFILGYLRSHPEGVSFRTLIRAPGKPRGMGGVAITDCLDHLMAVPATVYQRDGRYFAVAQPAVCEAGPGRPDCSSAWENVTAATCG